MGVFTYQYLGPEGLAGFDSYKYSCKDTSPLRWVLLGVVVVVVDLHWRWWSGGGAGVGNGNG